jgi:hypothetical protein
MKTRVFRVLLLTLSVTLAFTGAYAQNETLSAAAGDRYVISAKAGGVNFVEGTVTVARISGRTGVLLKGDSLEIGDRVSTSANGKVEILLNPGSFLRLGGDSEFEFKTTSLDNLKLQVNRGSAILEVYAANEFKVSVATPLFTYSLIESGVFRIDVPSNGSSRLRVWKGVAKAGSDEVKPGRSALAAGPSNVALAKFDRDERDALDLWSRSRSKELAKVTAKLRREDLRATLMQGFMNRRWDAMSSFGLWLFDPRYGSYFFLPFGSGWNSPYGYGYGSGMGWWWDDMPWYPWYPTTTPSGPPTGGGTTGPTGPTPSAIVTAGNRSPIPPFIRMEQINGGGLNGGSPGRGGNTYDPGSTSPSYSTPTYSPPSSSSSAPSSPPSTGAKSDPTGTKP